MWNYEKRLQYPVNITTPNAKIAQFIMSQYGGPDGEINASLRYLSQRFIMPNRKAAGVLNDVGTEELAHLEMVSTIVHQLTKDLSMEEIEKQQNVSEGKIKLRNNSSGTCIENELEESGRTTACTDLRKDKIACNGDASSSQIIDISDENEARGKSQLSSVLIL